MNSFPPGRIVDLSLEIAEELPCAWPGHMPFQHKTFNWFTQGGTQDAPLQSPLGEYQTRFLVMDEHTGTHFDAPAHFVPAPDSGLPSASPAGAITAEKLPLQQFMGSAVVIDVTELLSKEVPDGESPYVEPEQILNWEQQYGAIESNCIVLLRSDWDMHHYLEGPDGLSYATVPFMLRQGPGWPAPSPECIELLISRGVRCIGTDAPSMGSSHDGRPTHLAALAHGCVFIEGLAHLKDLPACGALFCFAPLRLRRGTGAPGRAFAWVGD